MFQVHRIDLSPRMEVMNNAIFNEQISNNEDKSTYENGDNGPSTLKQKSVFTISGVIGFYLNSISYLAILLFFYFLKTNFNVNAREFVSRRENSPKKIENLFKMSAPVPHIVPIPHGRSFHSNPDLRSWRCSSAHHIRHFDQSQSFDGYERRPVGANVLYCYFIHFYHNITGILSIYVARSSEQLR